MAPGNPPGSLFRPGPRRYSTGVCIKEAPALTHGPRAHGRLPLVTLTQLNIINVEIAAPTAAALFQLLAGPVFLTGGDTALRTGDGGVELETAELW